MDHFEVEGKSYQRSPTHGRSPRGGWSSLAQQTATANITFITLHIQYSVPGDISSPPATEDLNNANIEDMWVPKLLWLWTARRIECGTDSKQLKQSYSVGL